MSATEANTLEASVAPRHRRRRPWLVGTFALVVAATTATTLFVRAAVRDEGYGPIRPGPGRGFAGPGAAAPGEVPRRGTVGYAVSFLENHGEHDVRVTSLSTAEPVSGSGWAPATQPYTIFAVNRWRSFPATVPAHGAIQVRLTIGRPASCKYLNRKDGGHLTYVGGYDAHWRSRRSSHVTHVEQADFSSALRLC